MKVFYTYIDEFKAKYDKNFLIPYADKEFKNEKRFYEHAIGRYLVKETAKQYEIKDTEITTDTNGKPAFKNTDLYFSISHSENIVVACIDKKPCGIDIEYIKQRNLQKLSKYYKKEFNNLDDFYKFWTHYEAHYKHKSENFITFKFENYYLTITSDNQIPNAPEPEKFI